MLYTKKCAFFPYAVLVALARAADECVDIWAIGRCTSQKRKGNCVVAAQCPNPKKDGIKCTRARSQCMASCGLCDDDSTSSCAAEVEAYAAEVEAYAAEVEAYAAENEELQATNAELEATIASMTSPSPPPSPPPPPGADYPCDSAYNLFTLTEAYDWCATNCDGRTVKVISQPEGCSDTAGDATDADGYGCGEYAYGYCGDYDDSDFAANVMCCHCGGGEGGGAAEAVDYSDESGGVCAIADLGGEDSLLVPVTLTEHDDCFVVVSISGTEYGFGQGKGDSDATGSYTPLLGLGGNDVLCGGYGNDFYFYGGDGDDHLAGGPGRDNSLFGGAGADKIFGGLGDDGSYGEDCSHCLVLFYGGEGEDSIYIDPDDGAMDDDEGLTWRG